MAASWPTTGSFPAAVLLEDGYQERWAENTVRSQMDVGPAKVRRRSTAGVRRITCAQLLTTSQASTLQTFYQTTCAYGSISTYFTDPRVGGTIEVRFVNPPVLTAVGAMWRAQYEFEVLP